MKIKGWRIVAGATAACAVMVSLFWICSPYIVEFRAASIAGRRPFCILVSDHHGLQLYEPATSQSQLAFSHLTAKLENSGGSEGSVYITNYALLVLDSPREYLNWSYRALNFVRESLINVTHGTIGGKEVAIMPFKPCEPKVDFVATLK